MIQPTDALEGRLPSANEGVESDVTVRTRRSFLQKAAALGVIGAGVAAARTAEAQTTNPNVLPNLYRGWNAKQFRDFQDDENAHVDFILGALGDAARAKPIFQGIQQPNLRTFALVAKALENTGTGAYLGALPFISNPDIVKAAGSIALIEARHSGYANVLFNLTSTHNVFEEPQQFERALTIDEVISLAGPFIKDLNSDIPLTFSTTDLGPENDVRILNFALALEFLEQEFYNVNVPIFFP